MDYITWATSPTGIINFIEWACVAGTLYFCVSFIMLRNKQPKEMSG